MRSKQSRNVLFLSDMHVGNIYAVRSPDAEIESGNKVEMNEFNELMYNNWCVVRDMVQKKNIDVLCLNGEPIDGSNKKTNASGTWTSSIQKQLDDAERLIKMYKWQEIVMTRGSRYHVSVDNNFHEEVLAQRLQAYPYSGLFQKATNSKQESKNVGTIAPQYTDFYLLFKLGGKRFNVCHHVGYNRTELYRTTALARETAVMEFAAGKWFPKGERIDILVRSHVHYYVQIRFSERIAFTTPAWKLPDEFQLRGGLGGTAPNIGSIEVIIEPNGKIEVLEHMVTAERYPKYNEIDFDKVLK